MNPDGTPRKAFSVFARNARTHRYQSRGVPRKPNPLGDSMAEATA